MKIVTTFTNPISTKLFRCRTHWPAVTTVNKTFPAESRLQSGNQFLIVHAGQNFPNFPLTFYQQQQPARWFELNWIVENCRSCVWQQSYQIKITNTCGLRFCYFHPSSSCGKCEKSVFHGIARCEENLKSFAPTILGKSIERQPVVAFQLQSQRNLQSWWWRTTSNFSLVDQQQQVANY